MLITKARKGGGNRQVAAGSGDAGGQASTLAQGVKVLGILVNNAHIGGGRQ